MQFVRSCQGHVRQYQSLAKKLSTVVKNPVSTEYPIITGMLRSMDKSSGSYYSRKLRAGGMVPGVIYGVNEFKENVSIRVIVPVKPLNKQIRDMKNSLENTVQRLQLDDGSEYLVTARQLQIDPLSDSPQNINFLLYRPGNLLRIPLAYENADLSVDLKRGCFVARINRYVECVCTGPVPDYIMVDLTGKEKNDVIRVDHLVFPPGVRPSKNVKADYVIAVVQSAKSTK